MLSETQIQDFRSKHRGPLIGPNDASFDEVRKIYNAMIDRHPALIAQCRDVADVIQAVNFGRENNLDIAIRSGGHHGAGLSLVDNGLVIDLSPMKGIRVDQQAKTVRVEAGCTWGDVDHVTHAFGMATPSGILNNGSRRSNTGWRDRQYHPLVWPDN